mmetsp:Transcript_26105/g.34283  ORF Transcript_26105/g.34283 Transcript_26105/m.34283 type:complete len:513 (+) Transcript_26105:389-1927(+)|eukprot:CAMPEP_0117757938 /NCGR_PEP_ID=MMETSP0947-20121206/15064_1 /TAXON_ID=44440 /ORGANISM="Chattonella subsalsa, Strain CCMP2191" /LENGTH=512 /DNA_ID=CAMNT_0005577997 /DNA_START=282 /DNA_END=1820 /DNA_ORIENTATION=+
METSKTAEEYENEIEQLLQSKVELERRLQQLQQENDLLKARLHGPHSHHLRNGKRVSNEICTIDNNSTNKPRRDHLSRNVSSHTFTTLRSLQPQSPEDLVALKVLSRLKDIDTHLKYLNSRSFAVDLLHIAKHSLSILENEWRCLFLDSPVYVIGDIHGNIEDLTFFADYLWGLGMSVTAGKFLFLGDYVDRGKAGLECVAQLFALKVLHPEKVFLLRGNHETRASNGWEEHYGEDCFLTQCKQRFGDENGAKVWEGCNQVFDRLPLAAVVDDDIFCCHGGIPRKPLPTTQKDVPSPIPPVPRIHSILHLPNIMAITPRYEFETDDMNRIAMDILWGDPVKEDQEHLLGEDGFGQSQRGRGATCFGQRAVEEFLSEHNFSYIIRAHEAHSHGVSLRMAAKVFTVFSTSRDHGQGSKALAGCILIDMNCIKVINKSASYKNKLIHRENSKAFLGASQSMMDLRERLGLVDHAMEEFDRNNPFSTEEEDEDSFISEESSMDTELKTSHPSAPMS